MHMLASGLPPAYKMCQGAQAATKQEWVLKGEGEVGGPYAYLHQVQCGLHLLRETSQAQHALCDALRRIRHLHQGS